MKIETERRKWIGKAEREGGTISDVVELLQDDLKKVDESLTMTRKEQIRENFLCKYLDESSAFEIATCMYLISKEIPENDLEKKYSETTLEIAKELLKENKEELFSKGMNYRRDVNFFYRRSKMLINDYVKKEGMEKFRIEFALEIYDEVKFKIQNFNDSVKDISREKYLYKLIKEIISINYGVNRISEELPYEFSEMREHLTRLNYNQLNVLGVQYQELYAIGFTDL